MAWTGFRPVTVDKTKCGASDSSNYTLIICGTYSYLKSVANGGEVTDAAGDDICLYSDVGGTTLMNWALVMWDPTTGFVRIAVLVSTLTVASDFVCYLASGNAAITTFQGGTGAYHSSNVIASPFPDGVTLNANDYSGNGNHGTATGAVAVAGVLGGGATFDGSGDKIEFGSAASIDDLPQKTWEFLFRRNAVGTTQDPVLVMKGNGSTEGWDIELRRDSDGTNGGKIALKYQWTSATFATAIWRSTTRLTSAGIDYHILVTYDNTNAANVPTMYVNGVAETVATVQGALGTAYTDAARTLRLGQHNSGSGSQDLNARIEEFLMANVIRNASWAAARAANLLSPSTFYTIGASIGGAALVGVRTETVNASEAKARAMSLARRQAETVQASEATRRLLALVRSRAETVDAVEVVRRAMTIARLTNETVDVVEATRRIIGLLRSKNETVNVAEAFARTLGALRVQTETVQAAESVRRTMALARVQLETVNVTESRLRALGIVRWQAETATVTEGRLRVMTLARSRAETVNMSEAVRPTRGLSRVIGEVVQAAEARIALRGLSRVRNETVNVSESVADMLARLLLGIRNEFVNVSEAVGQMRGLTRLRTETVQATEAIARAMGLRRHRAEVVSVVEAQSRVMAVVRGQGDTVTVGEQPRRTMVLSRLRSDTVTVEEAVVRSMGFVRRHGDTVELVESLLPLRGLIAIRGDTVNIVEGFAGQVAVAIIGFLLGAVSLVPALAARLGVIPSLAHDRVIASPALTTDTALDPALDATLTVPPAVDGEVTLNEGSPLDG